MTTLTAPALPNLQLIALGDIAESPTNPRKHFNEAKLAELTESVRSKGVKQPLLVRPRWCVGLKSAEEVEAYICTLPMDALPYEIIAGARRFRAANLAELEQVPCIVEELDDIVAMDIQLIENLQRDDLTPTEEAQGYQDALALTVAGRPVHTVESLAARVNKAPDHIYERMLLLRLPAGLRAVVDAGLLPVSHAYLVARVPDAALREQAGLAVLHGHGESAPLSLREARELVKRDYMRELKGAPFDQENPALCAVTAAGEPQHGVWSGKCSDCPHRSGNIAGFDGKRPDICTNPRCFAQKAEAAYAAVVAEATAAGKLVLDPAEANRHFDPLGELTFTTTLVRRQAKPAPHLLKSEVKRAPTWAALAETAREAGMTVAVMVCRNPKTGVVEELIDSAPLIEAAEKIGEPIFRGQKIEDGGQAKPRAGEDADDAFARGKREHAAGQALKAEQASASAALLQATAAEALRRLHQVLRMLLPSGGAASLRHSLLGELVPEYVAAAGPHGLRLFVKAFDLKPGKGAFGHADAVELYVKSGPAADREALCMLLLLSESAAREGVEALGMVAMARALSVDLTAPPEKTKKPKAAKANRGNAEGLKSRKKTGKKPAQGKKRGAK